MKYLFILYVLNPMGEYSSFALDYGLTLEDCMGLHEQWSSTLDEYSTVFCAEMESV